MVKISTGITKGYKPIYKIWHSMKRKCGYLSVRIVLQKIFQKIKKGVDIVYI